ncbi:MAG: aspartate/glutamate racemase family protein [Coriobacteriales bacterium]|nr:aspartate/glutamate racemase family protein [Coriobacteriales bacterium]
MEFHRYAPTGVAISSQHVLFERVDEQGLIHMGERLEEAARVLATGEPDILAFACTMGSLVKGTGYDQELISRLEAATGIPVITTSTAVLAALRALKAEKLIIATPYSDEMNDIERRFLEDNGFSVLAIEGLQHVDPHAMPKITPDQLYRLVEEVFDPQADTIFVSCTGLGIIDFLPLFEADFQRQTIGSVQVTLWHTLRCLGIHDELPLGTLFSH